MVKQEPTKEDKEKLDRIEKCVKEQYPEIDGIYLAMFKEEEDGLQFNRMKRGKISIYGWFATRNDITDTIKKMVKEIR